jgi:molybdate transport system substrate-binding protein
MASAFRTAHPIYKNRKFSFNFQGTDMLVAQIQQGAPADVFAGASTKYGNVLFSGGLINAPANFCRNKLIVIMPKSNPARLTTLLGLTRPGVQIAMGDAAVPIGTYTRTVLTDLNALYGADYKAKVMANVVSNEVNVSAVVALVKLNEVDAGFVYKSDRQSAGTSVKSIGIPDRYQSNPLPTYPIARTTSCKTPIISRDFVKFVLGAKGQAIMKQYGFLPKPAAP